MGIQGNERGMETKEREVQRRVDEGGWSKEVEDELKKRMRDDGELGRKVSICCCICAGAFSTCKA